jgi:hypothetical protein
MKRWGGCDRKKTHHRRHGLHINRRSAALYAEIAEIDRGHHHECLYWAEREQEKAKEISAQIHAREGKQQR